MNGRICGAAIPNPTTTATNTIPSLIRRLRSGSGLGSPNVKYSANSAAAISK